ncbi:hypothetical protein AAF712_004495 [Marasmius tenuissimus]|uniref:Uncharacterized protein n=1 Tax=Marasmius tenuissimus TaxID=585030 RepID=A0ABR3A356_9AGAR
MASWDIEMPLLTTLRVDTTFSAHLQGTRPCWVAPRLNEVTLYLVDLQNDGSTVPVYWPFKQSPHQLTELVWTPSTDKSFLDIGHTLTQLHYCSLEVARHAGADGLPRCTLQQLRHLDIYGPFRSVLTIMNRLTLPMLEDFAFDFVEQISPITDHILSALGRLRQRSSYSLRFLSCPLAILSLQNSSVHLDLARSINELRVVVSKEERHEEAISNLSHSRLFPGLELLHVAFRELPDETSTLFSDIANMAEIRFTPEPSASHSTSLKVVSIEMADYNHSTSGEISVQNEAFQHLLGLQNRGLLLLGHIVDGMWHSSWRDTHWNSGEMTLAERRWHRFGRNDRLYRREFEDFQR